MAAQEGGFSTTRHALGDALGNPLRFILTAGQAGDVPQAIALLATVAMVMVEAALADRPYDSDLLRDNVSKS